MNLAETLVPTATAGPNLEDIAKVAIEDVRERTRAQVDLVYAIDRQAMTFFGYSCTVALAASTAAATLFGSNVLSGRFTVASIALTTGMVVLAFGFVAVAWSCLDAMRSRDIWLPGQGADFWQWAMEKPASTLPEIAGAYLHEAKNDCDALTRLSNAMARELRRARSLALAATIAGLGIALTAPLLVWLFNPAFLSNRQFPIS